MRGGQVSMEYMLVLGFSVLLLVPILIFFYTQSSTLQSDLVEVQARTAATTLVEAAERVYFSGPPTYETVSVIIPANVDAITISNTSIIFSMGSGHNYDLLVPSSVPLFAQSLDPSPGTRAVSRSSNDKRSAIF